MFRIIGITVLGKSFLEVSSDIKKKSVNYRAGKVKITLESFEWGVILHLERQLKKLRWKKGEDAVPPMFSADALKGL